MLEVRKYYQKGRALLMGLLVDDTAEERISELKGISIETSKIEKQNEKRLKKTEQDIQEPWDNYKEYNIYTVIKPEEEKKKRYYEVYLSSLGQREGNGTVVGFGKVVNGRAKDLRSMLTKFWRRKQPSIRRVLALLCLCHTQLKWFQLLLYSQWEAKRNTAKRCPTSKSCKGRNMKGT